MLTQLGGAAELLGLLGSLLRRPGRRLVGLRRELLCLPVGPRQENHYHSSLATREWAFQMPHRAPDLSIYGPVSWKYSSFDDPRGLLMWQHLFEGE